MAIAIAIVCVSIVECALITSWILSRTLQRKSMFAAHLCSGRIADKVGTFWPWSYTSRHYNEVCDIDFTPSYRISLAALFHSVVIALPRENGPPSAENLSAGHCKFKHVKFWFFFMMFASICLQGIANSNMLNFGFLHDVCFKISHWKMVWLESPSLPYLLFPKWGKLYFPGGLIPKANVFPEFPRQVQTWCSKCIGVPIPGPSQRPRGWLRKRGSKANLPSWIFSSSPYHSNWPLLSKHVTPTDHFCPNMTQ